MGPKKKKGKSKKEELRRIQEEERLLREKEEQEERQRLKEEQLRKEEEEKKEAYENKKRCEQSFDLQEILEKIELTCNRIKKSNWEEKRWTMYLYNTKEMDPYELPNINGYLSLWQDEESSDVQDTFYKIRHSLELIDTLETTAYVYPIVGEKILSLWNEGIENIKSTIARKLDFVSYMILKDAYRYLNEKTRNMEYSVSCEQNGEDLINLCLWANLNKSVRQRGMTLSNFTFYLPAQVVSSDCAVRILYTAFNHISVRIPRHLSLEDKSSEFDQYSLQKEYFPVGGVLYFELLALPKLTLRQNEITYVFIEDPILKKIDYKHIASPVFTQKSEGNEMKYRKKKEEETEAQKKQREEENFIKNLGNVILLRIKLPKHVIYWEPPVPARFCTQTAEFIIDGLHDIQYEDDEKEISFKVDQFGIFGFFQKKYLNLPYKNWHMFGGKAPQLLLQGQFYSITIGITNSGFQVMSLEPDVGSVLHHLPEEFTSLENLIQKLQMIGINIKIDDDAEKYTKSSSKNRDLEFNIYNCISLLTSICDFGYSKWNKATQENEFILKYRLSSQTQKNYALALVSPSKVSEVQLEETVFSYDNETVQTEAFSSNVFHFILSKFGVEKPDSVYNSEMIQNVKNILYCCKCLNFSS